MAKKPQSGKEQGQVPQGETGENKELEPGKGPKAGPVTITEGVPLQEREAVLEADLMAERIDEMDMDAPPAEVEDEEDFDEEVEYDGETDDEGDGSEVPQGEGKDLAAGAGGPADLAIERMRDENGQWVAEVFVPARAILSRYRAKDKSKQLYNLNAQLDILEPIGRMFLKEINGQWEEYLAARDLAEAGRLFSGFRQEKIATALGKDKSVLSRCRPYRMRLPKFGTVSLGELFDAAARAPLERAREVVARTRHRTPDKVDTQNLAALIAKELGVGKRQAQSYLKQLREEGLLAWPITSRSGSAAHKKPGHSQHRKST